MALGLKASIITQVSIYIYVISVTCPITLAQKTSQCNQVRLQTECITRKRESVVKLVSFLQDQINQVKSCCVESQQNFRHGDQALYADVKNLINQINSTNQQLQDQIIQVEAQVDKLRSGMSHVDAPVIEVNATSQPSVDDVTHIREVRHDLDIILRFLEMEPIGPAELRLMGGSSSKGRLELLNNGLWGTVCDDDFSNETAAVFCKTLGFSATNGSYYELDDHDNPHFGLASGPVWLDQVVCTGSETDISECLAHPRGVHDCVHNEDVILTCG